MKLGGRRVMSRLVGTAMNNRLWRQGEQREARMTASHPTLRERVLRAVEAGRQARQEIEARRP